MSLAPASLSHRLPDSAKKMPQRRDPLLRRQRHERQSMCSPKRASVYHTGFSIVNNLAYARCWVSGGERVTRLHNPSISFRFRSPKNVQFATRSLRPDACVSMHTVIPSRSPILVDARSTGSPRRAARRRSGEERSDSMQNLRNLQDFRRPASAIAFQTLRNLLLNS